MVTLPSYGDLAIHEKFSPFDISCWGNWPFNHVTVVHATVNCKAVLPKSFVRIWTIGKKPFELVEISGNVERVCWFQSPQKNKAFTDQFYLVHNISFTSTIYGDCKSFWKRLFGLATTSINSIYLAYVSVNITFILEILLFTTNLLSSNITLTLRQNGGLCFLFFTEISFFVRL